MSSLGLVALNLNFLSLTNDPVCAIQVESSSSCISLKDVWGGGGGSGGGGGGV